MDVALLEGRPLKEFAGRRVRDHEGPQAVAHLAALGQLGDPLVVDDADAHVAALEGIHQDHQPLPQMWLVAV
jgi:hypothetical protein